ncbi:hypothetical protein MUN81_19345 [Hymenobacter sp. 5317J-9]|uniref:hypothetical protein n=1 Tax=Hymenobacter sp. 5317J-9 TaxID=2932250 RepID=UPI001FD723A6|nr:hypothetical protein [Hymenobacter sp. 5317J-9]UOQ97379.1 hypothetical protein MUN81_19345 [Hymenobacter sp. 5317J-9]
MPLSKSLLLVALATFALLLIPLVAMQFSAEVQWTSFDFVVAGGLLFGAGSLFVLVARPANSTAYRLAAAVAVAAGLLLVWANLAVGLVGSEDNPANLLYVSVLAVALVGAIAARFRPQGMSRAMFGAALAYVLVTLIALFVWKPTGAAAEPGVQLANVLAANAAFAAMWVFSGWLFRRAAQVSGPQSGHRLA